jgi:hypothetical protein
MSKRVILAAGFAAALTLTTTPVSAQQFQMTAELSGGNEAPNKVTSGGLGNADCSVNVSARTITCTGTVFNLPSGVTQGHIHVGAEGVAGPVVCNAVVPVNASNDFNFSISCDESNIVLRPEIGIRSFEDFLQAVLGENAYVNIHSAVNPGGEVRGQLRRRRD